jgi:hypothetical protein
MEKAGHCRGDHEHEDGCEHAPLAFPELLRAFKKGLVNDSFGLANSQDVVPEL